MSGIEFNQNQKLALIVIIGLSVIGLSYAHIRQSARQPVADVIVREPDQSGAPSAERNPYAGKVVFQVAGCVKAPGVYELPAGERVMKAVSAAGGPKENADLQAINLAAKIEDGSRIYVPSRDETQSGRVPSCRVYSPPTAKAGETVRAGSRSASDKLRNPGEGTVHINSADENELQRLPGVGPATAGKILEYRGQIGKFSRPEQLMDVKGIGPKKFEKMRPFVTL
jgi:competence protein ComEA